ncbi:hypothetical protein Xinn_02345 [Xenorhabdus innexi]|uniref:Uncharacterized protein n=1 Tax=Xenorhabdus innexi TaxID=290109 RepID=A0A2G0NFP6_9GAMM|nr:hypothetical protein Xinn_02345 [Xenorhabdus innexi]
MIYPSRIYQQILIFYLISFSRFFIVRLLHYVVSLILSYKMNSVMNLSYEFMLYDIGT